jgi:hypothetical protein
MPVLLESRDRGDRVPQARIGNAEPHLLGIQREKTLIDQVFEHRAARLGCIQHGGVEAGPHGAAHPLLLLTQGLLELSHLNGHPRWWPHHHRCPRS